MMKMKIVRRCTEGELVPMIMNYAITIRASATIVFPRCERCYLRER